MVETPAAADFSDEFFLYDFTEEASGEGKTSGSPNPNCRRRAHLFEEILDLAVDIIPGDAGSRNGAEEEELEWLADKDAFPTLETSFDFSASAERPSPVSVLASALPFRAPVRSRSTGRRRRRKALPFFISLSPTATEDLATRGKEGKRKCRHCEAEETPQWREGPEGPKTLCNACGVRYKSGRLVPEYRPANSPTFSSAIHSNSHRRVVEMRRQKFGQGGGHGHERRRVRLPVVPHVVAGMADD
ncbi:hypothetical protein HPP92_025726 [Vanilla planifolia]|uniref:GATA-type domain-containing protein n=1 Tax=Vanilla planifolia TaxID=51239 RepID=A0A835PNE4_VANPL|nr:hypothetical protein HPP92_025991 [Vanilla planifolia]KAG0454422.1 hypothetical protein HPP92_025726 [Vanilla planifolia]